MCGQRGLSVLVLRPRPEEAAQPVALPSRHHMNMEVSNALTHDVVVRHEGSLRPHHPWDLGAQMLDPTPERLYLRPWEVGECYDVSSGHHQRVPREQRSMIEKRDNVIVGEHHVDRDLSPCNGTEQARLAHASMIASATSCSVLDLRSHGIRRGIHLPTR